MLNSSSRNQAHRSYGRDHFGSGTAIPGLNSGSSGCGSARTWVRLEPDLVSGEKIGRKHAWCEGLANTVRDVRDQGAGYGTFATNLGITNGKVRRILNASTAPAA